MPTWQPVLDRLTKLRATWPGEPWTWDGRFATVASVFASGDEAAARASAQLAFPQGFTARSIATAPAPLVAFAERTGLRANQRLLAGDAGLFGMWWPWGNNEKVTLRIGLLDLDGATEPMLRLRALFGV